MRPSKDSIWWAAYRSGSASKLRYCRTRDQAIAQLAEFLAAELGHGRRVLIGFDFPLGFPIGVAGKLTGEHSACALWDWVCREIRDEPNNTNNRFDVAQEVNGLYPGVGPFWGRPASYKNTNGVPTKGSARTCRDAHPPERRVADCHMKGAKSVWQLFGAGSVGSQVLVGLPALKRLLSDQRLSDHVAIWPFDSGLDLPNSGKKLVIVEVYPSLLKPEIDRWKGKDEILDRAQVRVNARVFADLDERGKLDRLFRALSQS